jgi:hypothetical protein
MPMYSLNHVVDWLACLIGPTPESPSAIDWSDCLIGPLALLLVVSYFKESHFKFMDEAWDM